MCSVYDVCVYMFFRHCALACVCCMYYTSLLAGHSRAAMLIKFDTCAQVGTVGALHERVQHRGVQTDVAMSMGAQQAGSSRGAVFDGLKNIPRFFSSMKGTATQARARNDAPRNRALLQNAHRKNKQKSLVTIVHGRRPVRVSTFPKPTLCTFPAKVNLY